VIGKEIYFLRTCTAVGKKQFVIRLPPADKAGIRQYTIVREEFIQPIITAHPGIIHRHPGLFKPADNNLSLRFKSCQTFDYQS